MHGFDATDKPDGDWVRQLPDTRPVTRVQIRLTDDEALVLSEWIYELQNDDAELDDEALWPAFYAINGPFESTSPLIFAPDYAERLEAARARVRAGGYDHTEAGFPVELTADQAVVLAYWLRDVRGSGRPRPDESVWGPLRRIGEAVEAKGIDGMSLSAARRRLLATMGRNEDGTPFEDRPGFQPACDATRRRLRPASTLDDEDDSQADDARPVP